MILSKAGVRFKFALVGILSVLISVGVTTGAVLWLMAADLHRQANVLQDSKLRMLHELVTAKGKVSLVDGKLKAGDHVINGNYEIVDRLQTIGGGVATIFMGSTRVSTNVRKEDGTRAVGTELTGPAHDAVLLQGRPYRGEAQILGVTYFTAYDPIKDASGKPLGAYFVGVKKADFYQSFKMLVVFAVLIAVIIATTSAVIMIYAVGGIMKDVVWLTHAAEQVSLGEGLEKPIKLGRPDEIGDLARAIDRLRHSMNAAMARL